MTIEELLLLILFSVPPALCLRFTDEAFREKDKRSKYLKLIFIVVSIYAIMFGIALWDVPGNYILFMISIPIGLLASFFTNLFWKYNDWLVSRGQNKYDRYMEKYFIRRKNKSD